MSANNEIVNKNEPKEQKNLFSLFPGFGGFKFPFPKSEPKKEAAVSGVVGLQENQSEKSKTPDVVTLPRKQLETPPPLKLEAEEVQSGKTSNPVILWQVYALGGFLILKWVWGRWQERKARNGNDDDEGSHEGRDDDEGSHDQE